MRGRNALWLHAALLLGILWLAGIGTRSVWTPDEPREYALSVNMLAQDQQAVPLLAGRPFAEKPPLTYWAAAGAMRLFGRNPLAARLPNILYGLITVLCTAWLVASMVPAAQRRTAAPLAAVVSGTAWLSYLHTIWLATDAPLLAGSAIALLGAWLGPTATTESQRRLGYLLFHVGLATAFLAKNLLGLIAPLLAFGLFILWDRRWRELLRWQLWAGLLVSAGLIGLWVLAVSQQADGPTLLHIFLWDNSVGRFLPVESTGDYRTGHQNSPGKLVGEVALGLMPWLIVAVVAWGWTLRQAIRSVPLTSAARYLAAAALPLIMLLSFSSTVRDVYALPSMVPLTAAVALWWMEHEATPRGATLMLTRALLTFCGLLALLLGVAVAWVGNGAIVSGAGAAVTAIAAFVLLAFSASRLGRALPPLRGLAVFAIGLCAFLLLASPVIERGQDLRPVARAAAAAAAGRPLLLFSRDETMAAALDYTTSAHGRLTADFAAAVRSDPTAVALVETDTDRLTPAMRARLASLHASLATLAPLQREETAQQLRASGWTLLGDFPTSGGRHYQLLENVSSR